MPASDQETEAITPVRNYSPAVIARAKYLYLTKSYQPQFIAAEMGLPVPLIHDWASNRGWAKMRRERILALDRKISAATDKVEDELMLSLAPQTHELAEDTLEFARETLNARDAKGLALTSQALKNFVGVYRMAKGLDATAQGSAVTFNAFYMPAAPASPKPADQAQADSIDVSATPTE